MSDYVETALARIKDIYEKTDKKLVLSFSGGKDSTVLAELYFMAKERGMVGHIPIIFADTQVEYNAIYEFVEWFSKNKQEVIYLKPRKSFPQVLKEYGKPTMSKIKSDFLSTYQKNIGTEKDPLEVIRINNLITGYMLGKDRQPMIKNGKKVMSKNRLANKHFNFLHHDHEYKISSKCCDYLKKLPFEDYYVEHDINGALLGIRLSEGGLRAMVYTDYIMEKDVRGKDFIHGLPLIDWSEKQIEQFIKGRDLKLSKAYTEYGLDRTGCIGCPFAKDIDKNLKILYDFEPNKYKAVQRWLGDVYVDLEVELPFDQEYTQKLQERMKTLQERRYKMLKQYRPKIAHKWKPKIQLDLELDDENN